MQQQSSPQFCARNCATVIKECLKKKSYSNATKIRLSVIRFGTKTSLEIQTEKYLVMWVGSEVVLGFGWGLGKGKGKGIRKNMLLAGYVHYFKDIRQGSLLSYCVDWLLHM